MFLVINIEDQRMYTRNIYAINILSKISLTSKQFNTRNICKYTIFKNTYALDFSCERNI